MGIFQTAVLASNSSGNCFLVRTDKTKLLFDVGLSWKKTQNALLRLALSPQKIKGIVISHEHSDHIRGVGVICRKLKIPVYITELTYQTPNAQRYFGKISSEVFFFNPGDYLEIGDLIVHPFPSSHDAVDACNFTVRKDGLYDRKLAIATDLGFSSKLLLEKLKSSTTIILESNHDLDMLMNGFYPWSVKQRIKSKIGHLSNDQAVGVLTQIMHEGLENVVLAHLSEENNNPQKAMITMQAYLKSINAQTKVHVSESDCCTPLLDI